MASLKLAVIWVLMGILTAALAGSVEVTVGARVSGAAPVVKVQLKELASGLPARSLAEVVMVPL